jgi:methylglutaconyl-CoA hydratase
MIKFEIRNHTGLIILNRPEKRNALHPQMISLLKAKLGEYRNDRSIKNIIITGEGNSFCAGADLSYLNELKDYSSAKNEEDSEKLADLFLMFYDFPKPIIAAVNGPAIAGGCGVASVCDFIIADKMKSKFGYSEVKIGFIPAVVSVFLIKKIGEGKSKQLLLSSEIINAEKALQIGLVDYLSDNVLEDSLLNNISNMKVRDAVNYCIRLNVISRSSEGFKNGINNFLNKDE